MLKEFKCGNTCWTRRPLISSQLKNKTKQTEKNDLDIFLQVWPLVVIISGLH